ncbi:MAG: BNR-4 repeat-containing protein [Clostridia bacterium]|nr:BNR-4 repeat-containing protein [Clostridia bacterium]
MIDLEKVTEKRIKRANTEWWINERAVVADNGMTYIAYMTDMGEIHIKELDAKCSRTPSRDFRLSTLNCNYADEHNAPSLCVMESGRIAVAYTGHNSSGRIKYRVTKRPYDIFSFGKERYIEYSGEVTYAQLFENTERGELWLFSRVSAVNWEFRYSRDEGESWSEPVRFLHSEDGGLFYFNIRKMLINVNGIAVEQWFFALYGHPRISADHTIRTGIFNSDGILTTTAGKPLGVNLFDGASPKMELSMLDVVYSAPDGATVRLLENAPTLPLRVGFAPFVLDKPETAFYHSATFRDGRWQVSQPICPAGEFLTSGMIDGSQTYLGGMAYYYGVGEAGLHPNDPAPTVTNRIYIARYNPETECRVVESYLSRDCGKSYTLEQNLRSIPKSHGVKTWRPIVPLHAQDNLPVYWHEGVYEAHTVGWHCDAILPIEYDD